MLVGGAFNSNIRGSLLSPAREFPVPYSRLVKPCGHIRKAQPLVEKELGNLKVILTGLTHDEPQKPGFFALIPI
jgi:hypothetical protein